MNTIDQTIRYLQAQCSCETEDEEEEFSKFAGLYGLTKTTQNRSEACIRKSQREARKIASKAYHRDKKVAEFWKAHHERTGSLTAKALLLSLHEELPTLDKVAAGGSLYGFPARTVKVGLDCCNQLLIAVGGFSQSMRNQKSSDFEKITEFFTAHCQSTDCVFAKIIQMTL